ncbi:alpha-mannosidase [Thermogladius sp. 4427co]|uniref:alpha-mannosidase n=1 Tax=Thermogladius sp. 4427co TaxID=3450718 RepID=UPI003F792599
MTLLRDLRGIRTELFYIDTASTMLFRKLDLGSCGEGSRELCGEVYVDIEQPFILVDLVGEGTLQVNEDRYAVYRTPDGGHENRFIPIEKGFSKIVLRPSVVGPFGEKLFDLKGVYLYVKEPWSYRFVVEATLLTDLAEATRDEALIKAINSALDQIEIEGVADWQIKASTLYSIAKPPFYIASMKYYGIEIDPSIEPMDHSRLSEMSRRALETLRSEVSRIYNEVRGSEGALYAVGHAHIDVAWLWTPDVTRHKVRRTLYNVLSLSKKYDMRFVLSNAVFLKWIREDDEELYKKLIEAVNRGIVIPVGGMWVESDTNVVGGESLVRQFLYGQRTLLETFGRVTEIGWLPDSFGFTASLPQILVKSGIKIFFTHKLYWNKQNRFPYSIFKWVGVDGSEVVAVNYATYGSDLSPRQIINAWRDHTSPELPGFIAFGHGDGGGGPTWLMMERLRVYSRAPGAPRLILSDPYRYYETVRNSELPVWRGELYLEAHRGTYSTGHKIKKLIRLAEEYLKDLEVISFIFGEKRSYRDLWEILLEAEFHDTASATLVDEAYRYYVNKLSDLIKRIDEEISSIIKRNTQSSDKLIVINTLPWRRRDVVRGRVKGSIQQVIDGEIYSLVEVSPMSIEVFEEGEGFSSDLMKIEGDKISNGIIEVDSRGAVRDLENDVEVVKRSFIVACEDIPAEWDGWDIEPWYKRNCRELKPYETEIVERGSLRSCIERRYKYRKTEFREKICLWRESRRIDFRITGFVRDRFVLFRELFELGFNPVSAEAEIPYGVIRRSIEPENTWDQAKFEFPVWRWLDVYSIDYGLAIMNKGRSGHSIDRRFVGITLLKTPIFPNPRLDYGEIDIEFALYPHRGTWRDAEIPRRAVEYHRPLRSFRGYTVGKSLLRIDPPNLLLETIKYSENGHGYIARIWETYGRRSSLKIEAEETDLIELNFVKRNEVLFEPYEIKSLKLTT